MQRNYFGVAYRNTLPIPDVIPITGDADGIQAAKPGSNRSCIPDAARADDKVAVVLRDCAKGGRYICRRVLAPQVCQPVDECTKAKGEARRGHVWRRYRY